MTLVDYNLILLVRAEFKQDGRIDYMTRSIKQQPHEENWFGFAAPLRMQCDSDYIALRLLAYTEPNATAPTMYKMMIEVLEKSLKFFITVKRKSETAFTEAKNEFGYNIQKLLVEAQQYNSVFGEPEITGVAHWFGDNSGKYLHHLRYGSGDAHSNPRTVNLGVELAVVDAVFFNSMILLPEPERSLFLGGSLLRSLVSNTVKDQYPNSTLTLQALRKDNGHFREFEELCDKYDREVKEANSKHLKMNGPGKDLAA